MASRAISTAVYRECLTPGSPRRFARASPHRLRQDTFKFFQVGELGSNVFEMMRGNLADFAARGFFRASQPEKSADFVERKP
jgi:hypothetical protein